MPSLPQAAGVYRVYDSIGTLIYIGKSKNLRRRISQYRNAKRLKKHRKMREIIKHANQIKFEICGSDVEASLLEVRLIQRHRPRFNLAGAFSFLYPMIGVRVDNAKTYFCYTTVPESMLEFSYHGAFRSRFITRRAFLSLTQLLAYVADPLPRRLLPRRGRSEIFGYRRIPEAWLRRLDDFFTGNSRAAIEDLVLALVENAGARRSKRDVQEHLNNLNLFWVHEARSLKAARDRAKYQQYPVAQAERDLIFIKGSPILSDARCVKTFM